MRVASTEWQVTQAVPLPSFGCLAFRKMGSTEVRKARQPNEGSGTACVTCHSVLATIRLSGFQENGFHGSAVELKIQRRGGGGMRGRAGSAGAHPSCQGLPLGIVLRIPVLASGMEGIATCFGGQRMHQ